MQATINNRSSYMCLLTIMWLQNKAAVVTKMLVKSICLSIEI